LRSNNSFWQSGFTLVQVLIAVAIMGVLATVGTQLITNLLQSQKYVTSRSQLELTIQSMLTIVKNSESCAAAFLGQPLTPGGVVDVKITRPNGKSYEAGMELSPGLSIDKITLEDSGLPTVDVSFKDPVSGANLPMKRYQANLNISFKGSVTDNTLIVPPPRKVLISVIADPANLNKIATCVGGEVSAQNVCEEAGGIYDPTKPPNARCNLVPSICAGMGISYVAASNSCGCPSGYALVSGVDGLVHCTSLADSVTSAMATLQGCLVGGAYATGTGSQVFNNPITGLASCPSGFTATVMGNFNYTESTNCGKGGCTVTSFSTQQYLCLKCSF
jgi:prepilin-type N-terminal cleavage/methylation domain-containing protein